VTIEAHLESFSQKRVFWFASACGWLVMFVVHQTKMHVVFAQCSELAKESIILNC